MIKRKRASVPVTILVIGVFAICSFALLTFLISEFKFNQSFVGVAIMGDLSNDINEYHFYKSQNVAPEKIEKYLNISEDSEGKFIYVEKKGVDFKFRLKGWRQEKLLFSVKYYFPE